MDSYFLPAQRQDEQTLRQQVHVVSQNPVVNELLRSVDGVLAVLNEDRQILAFNDSFLTLLNSSGEGAARGTRIGEALGCIYSKQSIGGCGTGEMCTTCGAAIAMSVGLATNEPYEQTCAMQTEHGGQPRDVFLRVRCAPITYESQRFLLLFLQDISHGQQLAELERVFFHDINNLIMGIAGNSEILSFLARQENEEVREKAQLTNALVLRLASEMAMHRTLVRGWNGDYQPQIKTHTVAAIVEAIKNLFDVHPLCQDRTLEIGEEMPAAPLQTDSVLVTRVLTSMVVNALEATEPGGRARLWVTVQEGGVTFHVWNRQAIGADVAKRIFQRNFSTKAAAGRGLGTYAMKLFGEKILGGQVDFTCSPEEGTTFTFSLKAQKP